MTDAPRAVAGASPGRAAAAGDPARSAVPDERNAAGDAPAAARSAATVSAVGRAGAAAGSVAADEARLPRDLSHAGGLFRATSRGGAQPGRSSWAARGEPQDSGRGRRRSRALENVFLGLEFMLGFMVACRRARVDGAVGARLPPVAARDQDSDRRAHEDRRPAGVERRPARLHAVAGRAAVPVGVAGVPVRRDACRR